MSHKREIQAIDSQNRRIVLRLTGLTEEQYVNLQLDTAREYLLEMLGEDPMGIEHILAGRIFWTWFINRWNRQDAAMVIPALYHEEPRNRAERYRIMHYNALVVTYYKPQLPERVSAGCQYFSLIQTKAAI